MAAVFFCCCDNRVNPYDHTAVVVELGNDFYYLGDGRESQILVNLRPKSKSKVGKTIIPPEVIQYNFDTEFSDKRVIVWTLGFTMQGWIFGPVSEDNVGIIRRVITDFHNVGGSDSQPISDEDVAKTPRHVRITIDPDPIDASPDDEFGYNTTIEDFNDNKKRNPVTGEDEEIP